jgi:hypothetical protein
MYIFGHCHYIDDIIYFRILPVFEQCVRVPEYGDIITPILVLSRDKLPR